MPLVPAFDLLAVVREFLEADLLSDSALTDDKRFNLRVAINLLAMAERELRLGPVATVEEENRLTALIGNEGSLQDKNRRLARAIRDGVVNGDEPQLLEHLQCIISNALRINNPKWIEGQ